MKKMFWVISIFIAGCSSSSDKFVQSVDEIKVGDTYKVVGDVFYVIGNTELFLWYEKGNNEFPSTKLEQGTLLKVLQIRRVRTSVEAFRSVSRYYIKVRILEGAFKDKEVEAEYIFMENGEYKSENSRISLSK